MMNVQTLLDNHTLLCKQARELMKKKNHDYTGGSHDPFANFRMASAIGVNPVAGLCLRIGDKLQRLITFAEKGNLAVTGEGIEDSVKDIINYAVLAHGLLTENRSTPTISAHELSAEEVYFGEYRKYNYAK